MPLFPRNGSGEGLSELVMEFPAVLIGVNTGLGVPKNPSSGLLFFFRACETPGQLQEFKNPNPEIPRKELKNYPRKP